MSNKGFDPDRIKEAKREAPVIPQILSAETPHLAKGFTEIKVVGVGGGGSNTVNRMIESGVQGIDFIAINTDVQALANSLSRHRIQIGDRLTRGLGAGGDARIGERAAESDRQLLFREFNGADLVFITAGLGGGTGTGALPIVAEEARRTGALTVAVVTLPFGFEGNRRRSLAAAGLEKLRPLVDSIIVISNDRLLATFQKSSIKEAFRLADDTLHNGIHGIADLILTPGLINLDFADVQAILQRGGSSLMSMGTAGGENRAARAAEAATTSPLLDASIHGARGVLLNITGGPDLTLHEVNEAASIISAAAAPDANIIFGAVIHPHIHDEIRVTVIAAGFGS